MSELEKYLISENRVWYSSIALQNKFGLQIKNELNQLYLDKKIEVRNGVNDKVIRYIDS